MEDEKDGSDLPQKNLIGRLGELVTQLEHMEVKSLAEYYAKPRQVIFFNVVLGIS